jgi:HD-GYP domain-containing protein (c-di-GMP phosphodiesterase class II)/HAMP domain-containing protein
MKKHTSNLTKFILTKHGSLHSKVAQRIFVLFILCALVPLSALAYISFSQVTKELYYQADNRLQQVTKVSGMSIIERLTFLEDDLQIIISNIHKGKTDFLQSSTNQFRDVLKERFKGIVLVDERRHIAATLGEIHILPSLTKDEIEHIHSGKMLLITRPGRDKFANIFIVKALGSNHSPQAVLLGEINPEYLWNERSLSSTTEVLVLDESGNMIFSSSPEYSPLIETRRAMQKNYTPGNFTWTRKGSTYLASYRTIFMRPQFHNNWVLVESESKTDIMAPISFFKKIFFLLVVLTFLVVLFFSLLQIRRRLVPIEMLQQATKRIAAKDFKDRVDIRTNDEFEELGSSFNEMASSIETHLQTMTMLNRVGIALSAEKNNDRLLELILVCAKDITNADGCALYTLTKDSQLKLSVMRIGSIKRDASITDDVLVPLYNKDGNPNTRNIIAYSALTNMTVNIPDIYAEGDFDISSIRDFDRRAGYKTQSSLSVPLRNHDGLIVGVLQLTNARNTISRQIVPFSHEDQRLLETLASQAAVALSKNQLIDDLKKLFDSLIELLAKLVDEKSPYTGDHSRKTTALTMLLAEAINNDEDGIFKEVSLSEEELYELKVAALLHDCGKVTTPAHIADKATKLETVFDRIHLIDTRFEVLRRDVQIALLKAKITALRDNSQMDVVSLEEEIKERMSQIDEDRDFVRRCNSGETFIDEPKKNRLYEIAQKYKWVTPSGEQTSILSDEELYNLSIPSGTVTSEERLIINKHVTTSKRMLESLPYPKNLQNVPRFVGAHHETMDGKGYPDGLVGNQIPLQARIIAIADIFEALTSKSRPYKKQKTFIEALYILGSMKRNGQIDPDLFDLFMGKKLYEQYPESHLDPEQIDEVVISKIPGC